MNRGVHASANKHGVSAEDALHASNHPVLEKYVDEDNPARQLILGFDTNGRVLELVLLVFDIGNELIVHAMPARKQYLKMITSWPSTDHRWPLLCQLMLTKTPTEVVARARPPTLQIAVDPKPCSCHDSGIALRYRDSCAGRKSCCGATWHRR